MSALNSLRLKVRQMAIMGVALVCAGAMACSRGESKTEALKLPTPEEVAAAKRPAPKSVDEELSKIELPPNSRIDPIIDSQRDIGLKAMIEGNKLKLSIANKTKKAIIIGPKNIGVVPAGTKELIHVPDPQEGFPPSRLEPGDERVALIPLRIFGDLTLGTRVIFNHPECRPAIAALQWGAPPANHATPQK